MKLFFYTRSLLKIFIDLKKNQGIIEQTSDTPTHLFLSIYSVTRIVSQKAVCFWNTDSKFQNLSSSQWAIKTRILLALMTLEWYRFETARPSDLSRAWVINPRPSQREIAATLQTDTRSYYLVHEFRCFS